MKISLNILKKGDTVKSVNPYGNGFAIIVENKKKEFEVILVERNNDEPIRVTGKIFIGFGDDVVEVEDGDVKFSTF